LDLKSKPAVSPVIKERENALIQNYSEKHLNKNFRSKIEIIDFNNQFFENLSHNLDTEYQTIYSNSEQFYPDEKNTGGLVSIEFLDPAMTLSKGEENSENRKENWNEIYCETTFRIINEVRKDGYELRDVAVLCRTNKEGAEIAEFLIQQGIDVVSSESLLLQNSEEVNFILNVFRYIIEPENKIFKTKIIQYLLNNYLINTNNFHQTISEFNANKFILFLNANGYFLNTNFLLQLPLLECCEEIIRVFKLNKIINPYIQFFIENIYQYTSKNNNNISDFLEWWEENKEKKSIVIPQGTNAVTVMTIHKSKGLQFPVVIFPFANWIQKNAKENLWIDFKNEKLSQLKSAIIPTNKSVEDTDFAALYTQEKNKSLLDNFNVLYVAMTRPEERLYVLTSLPKGAKKLSQFFIDYLENINEWNEDRTVYTFGKTTNHKPQTTSHKPQTNYILEQNISEDWKEKISIARKAPQLWDFENFDEQKRYGNLVHTALSKIKTISDIDNALNSLLIEGLLTMEEKNKLEIKLNSLINNSEIKPFFAENLIVKTEAEILKQDGSAYRPDRVCLTPTLSKGEGEKVIVIDFKTGKEEEKHKTQLDNYADLLVEMGYSAVEKYLIYTEEEKIVACI